MPRYAFTDLPLGNPVGPADDPDQQRRVLRTALAHAESAASPLSSVVIPTTWNGPENWASTYMSLEDPDGLAAAGEQRRARQAADKAT